MQGTKTLDGARRILYAICKPVTESELRSGLRRAILRRSSVAQRGYVQMFIWRPHISDFTWCYTGEDMSYHDSAV